MNFLDFDFNTTSINKVKSPDLGSKIKVKGKIARVTFPRSGYKAGDWTVFTLRVDEIIEGQVSKDLDFIFNELPFVGNTPSIDRSASYCVTGSLIESKYGLQYEVINMNEDYTFETVEQQRIFLETILTPHTVSALYSKFDNPIDLLANEDVKSLISVSGIGEKTAMRLITKYRNSIDMGPAYVQLVEYGLTKRMIDKLVRQFKSATRLVNIIKTNPYFLIKIARGIGWAKADEMALNAGMPNDSPYRIDAYIDYYLDSIADQRGHTWIDCNELISEVKKMIPTASIESLKAVLGKKILAGIEMDKEMNSGNETYYNIDDFFYSIENDNNNTEIPDDILEYVSPLFYDKEKQRIGMKKFRTLEEKIAKELIRIKDGEKIKIEHQDETLAECEKQNGWKYTDEQKNIISNILNSNNIAIVTGKAGCVDKDTQYFNGTEWKNISDYTKGEKVLQYNIDRKEASLVVPEAYIKQPCELMYYVRTAYSMDLCASPEHNVYYEIKRNAGPDVKPLSFIKTNHEFDKYGFVGELMGIFDYRNEGNYIDMSDDEIEIATIILCNTTDENPNMLKFCGKNHFVYTETDKMGVRYHRFPNVSEEFASLAKRINLKYTEEKQGIWNYFYLADGERERFVKDYKEFPKEWLKSSNHQLKCFASAFLKWHALKSRFPFEAPKQKSPIKERYVLKSQNDFDFMQFCLNSLHIRVTASIMSDGRFILRTHVYPKTRWGISPASMDCKPVFETVVPEDHMEYCFTVPDHYWVMRKNNKMLITGNCGKSSIMFPITKAFENNGLKVAQCALSGKAALNLTEITGIEGKTIHRLLCYNPEDGSFMYNKNNKLPYDIIIIDELSMVGGEIFYSLLQAIKTGAKLICIGDTGQLESIGICNCLHDMISSKTLAHYHLTKIMRQAEDSAIITNAAKIYEGEQIIPNGFDGRDVRGKNEDFEIISASDTLESSNIAFNEYVKTLEAIGGVSHLEDICLLTSKRGIGEASARALNDRIHNYLHRNDNEAMKNNFVKYHYVDSGVQYDIHYMAGDRVKVTKNCYKTLDTEGKINPVFNGNVGTVIWVDPESNSMCVNFLQGDVILDSDNLANLQLGYAITTHSAQGSGFPYVIAICDPSAFPLNCKEMLYTQITRAKKKCVLIGPPQTIRSSVSKTNVKKKQTWLSDLIVQNNNSNNDNRDNSDNINNNSNNNNSFPLSL